jgi:phosphatidate cytidylyltransferase
VTRVVSGAVLVLIAIAVVWFASPVVFLIVAEILLLLAFSEYVMIAGAHDLPMPGAAGVATAMTSLAFSRLMFAGSTAIALDVVLMSVTIAVGSMALLLWRGGKDALPMAGTTLLPILYLGLPFGALVAVRETHGPAALFLLMLTVMVSDTAQYYAGRLFGRRPLAPAISPKKTVEGAIGGFVFGTLLLAAGGYWWLPAVPLGVRIVLGAAIVALGIAGDLFESMLKRSAGVKDSSTLIPGHGGVLDRIDALLFAAPIYYVVLKYV